jgi:hypothetical protein
MLILDMCKDKTAPFFYKDEYDPEVYSARMFFSD